MVAVENAPAAEATAAVPTKSATVKQPEEAAATLGTYPVALPICVVRDAKGALAFYEAGLGATVSAQYPSPNGKIMHAMLEAPIGGGFKFAVEDDGCMPELVETANVEATKEGSTRAGGLYLYVTLGAGEVDGVVERMREAGGVVTMDCKELSYGARVGKVLDPYGIAWSFASTTKPAHGDAEEKADKEDGEAPKPTESAKEAEPAKEEEPAKEADAPKSEAAPMEEEKKE